MVDRPSAYQCISCEVLSRLELPHFAFSTLFRSVSSQHPADLRYLLRRTHLQCTMSDQTNLTSALGNSIIALIDFQIAHTGPDRPLDTPAYTSVGTHSVLVNNVTTSLTNLIQARIEQHINPVRPPQSQVVRGDHESHLASLPLHLRAHAYLASDPGYGAPPLNEFVPAPDPIAHLLKPNNLPPRNINLTSMSRQSLLNKTNNIPTPISPNPLILPHHSSIPVR